MRPYLKYLIFSVSLPRTVACLAVAVLLSLPLGCGGGGGGGGGDGVTVPTLESTTPLNNATDVDPETIIVINFSEPMDTTFFGSEGAGDISPTPLGEPTAEWSNDDQTLTITFPPYSFREGTKYTLTLYAGFAKDREGTALDEDAVLSFTTWATVPYVTGAVPAHLDTGVATDVTVHISFSEAMDIYSFEGNASVSGIPVDNISAQWNTTLDGLSLTFTPSLAEDTTYTLSLGALVSDRYGTPMGQVYQLVFSTGGTLAQGAISGTISDDPDSPYDDDLSQVQVGLFDGDPMSETDVTPLAWTMADSGGAYHFSYLPDGSYWPAGGADSNGDGDLNPEDGDSVGIYVDWASPTAVNISSGSSTTGVDFALLDTEAITGRITFDVDPGVDFSGYAPWLYAYVGSEAFTAQMYLTSDPNYTTDDVSYETAEYEGDLDDWKYRLNPYLISALSVEGQFSDDSVEPVDRDYIPPGDYGVYAELDLEGDYYGGFAPSLASISGTGGDAAGMDVTLYQLTSLHVRVEKITSMGDEAAVACTTARVSLLGWPMMTVLSSGSYDYGSGTIQQGVAEYNGAPVGLPVAIHGEPDPADAGSFLAASMAYWELSYDDYNTEFNLPIINRATLRQLADLPGGPGASSLDFIQAFVGGAILDSNTPVEGATVTISTGNTVYYLTTVGGQPALTTSGGTAPGIEGPQFFIFNVTPTVSQKGTLWATKSGVNIPTAIVPLRAGELTFAVMFEQPL